MTRANTMVAAIAGGLLLAGPVLAEGVDESALDDSIGAREFKIHCAVCHGEDGRGQGPLAELLTVPVADLTQISARNEGRFPFMRVSQIIDGRTGIRGHGYPMPVWGDRFMAEAEQRFGPFDAEALVRGRILELVYYLQGIQQ